MGDQQDDKQGERPVRSSGRSPDDVVTCCWCRKKGGALLRQHLLAPDEWACCYDCALNDEAKRG
jgi:hypothetical protein